jgi:hypothetical protein
MGKMPATIQFRILFSMPLMEDCRLRVVQKKVLRRIIIHKTYGMINV